MQMEFTEEQQMMRDMVRDYAQTKLKPRAAKVDETGEFPWDSVKEMAELGLFGMLIPEEYGGIGADYLTFVLTQEEIARACMSTVTIVGGVNSIVAVPICQFGNSEQKARFLPEVAAGRKLGAYALTEADAGSDPASMRMTAAREGDEYLLDGEKVFITNGGVSDLFVVFAVTDPSGQRGRNISAFVVDKTDPGSQRLTLGKPEPKLGIKGSNTVNLSFEGVRVPAANRLGAEGEGLKIALATLDSGRISIAAQGLGVARAALDEAIPYANQRTQFGRTIGSNQGLSFQLADCATQLEAATHLTYHAAQLKDRGQPYGQEAAMAKLYASEMAAFVTDVAVQVFGGYGYSREYPVERYWRDARILRLYEGTSEIQRLVIARKLGLGR